MSRKHNKQGIGKADTFVCDMCKLGYCGGCLDVLRSVYSTLMICKCKRKDHVGEAVANQIADPFTGSVHGPGAEITADGEVKIDADFKRQWTEQFG